MKSYSIKELEQLSGIKAHTIRIWEKRYNVLNPSRSEGNIRLYSDHDLKRVLNLAYLNRQGIKISKLANYKDSDFEKYVNSARNQDKTIEKYLNKMLIAALDMDEVSFYETWNAAILDMSFEESITEIIFPLLTRIGLMWMSDKMGPFQEHFVSHLIRCKVIAATAGLSMAKQNELKSWVLYLPEGEWHELGLLLYNYLLRKGGHKTYYLGQSVPLIDLTQMVELKEPDYLITSHIAIRDPEALAQFVNSTSVSFPNQKILISMNPEVSNEVQSIENVRFISGPEDIPGLILKN